MLPLAMMSALAILTSVVTLAAPPDAARIASDIAELSSDAMNGRAFHSADGVRAAEWVAAKLAQTGAKPLDGRDSMLVPIARDPKASPNVVAWIAPRGKAPTGEYILVTAHYDHLPNARSGDDRIYNGADDNASGTCGMIAVAETLRDIELNVGVVFVGFTGEEAGMIGSRAFIEEETLPIARIRADFNMDMISRTDDAAIRLDGGPQGKVLVDLLVRLAPQVMLDMKVDTHLDWLQRSDQGAFLSAGIPAVLFSCEDHVDYHKVSDHADKTDSVLAAKTAALVALAVPAFAAEMSPRFDTTPLKVDALETQARTLRVGRTREFAPFWIAPKRRSKDRGFDGDFCTELGKRLGWKLEEKSVAVGDEVRALEQGEVDVIVNGFFATPKRGAEFALTAPYLTSDGIGALVKRDSELTSVTLDGKKLGLSNDEVAAAWQAQFAPGATVIALNGPAGAAATMIENGELDAVITDFASASARAQRDKSFRALLLQATPIVCALRSHDSDIAARISAEIAAMESDGTLATSRGKYALAPTHRVIGQDKGRVIILSAQGNIEWEVPCNHNSHDLAVLGNGNVLLHRAANEIVEMTPEKKIVWQWKSTAVAPYTGSVEIHGFQRLGDGSTMIAETGNLRIIEVDAAGTITRSVPITVEHPDAHRDTRRVRKTADNTYLVCHEGLGLVREYDATGKIVWEYALDLNNAPSTGGHDGHGTCVFNALRLKNGNTLIAGGNNNRVMEVSADKKIVWSIERDELKRADGRPIHLCWVTSLQVLANGNIIVGNTHAGPDQPQMFEVTRDKRVVWELNDWNAFGNDLCTGWCMDLTGEVIR